jgi:hypothetical protein
MYCYLEEQKKKRADNIIHISTNPCGKNKCEGTL